MRVVLLISAPGWRGSGASYAKLARGLRARGHEARLVTASTRLTERLREEGVAATQIPGRGTGLREVLALRRALADARAQAIIADRPPDMRLSFYATLLRPARIVYRYNLNSRRTGRRLMDRVYATRLAACVYQSRYIQETALRQASWMRRIPSYQIPNGYDTAQFAPQPEAGRTFRERYGIPASAHVVLSAGRLNRSKGQEVGIAALARLRQEGAEVVYVLCGSGQREAELSALARASRVRAVFTGLLGTRDMVAAYSAADVVVHPSLEEIFPNAVGEAMACARPVIASDAGGTGELLGRDGRAGILVPPADPGALAGTVAGLLAAPERRHTLGEAARRRIETEFPLDRMVAGYEHALAEVLDERG